MTSTRILPSAAPATMRMTPVSSVLALDRLDRLGGVLDDVAERLGHQPAVERAHQRLGAEVALEGDVGAADLDQERRLAQRLAQIHHLHLRLRHAGEGRELVDHAADIADLADDGVGALVEDLAVLGDDLAVAAADALGGELDRGQRVLDLVGDAARHVGPGRGALRLHEIGDVVDGDDVGLLVGLALASPRP